MSREAVRADMVMPKIVKATSEQIKDLQSIIKEIKFPFKKSKSLTRFNNSKQEINHRLIPCDLLLDAKPNLMYNKEQKQERNSFPRIMPKKETDIH